jgi:AmmeMemoRadiSam system protein A
MREENKHSPISIEKAKELIQLAREAIEKKEVIERGKSEKAAVFVTLEKNRNLRGCIGFTERLFPLEEAVQRAAISAAYEDPRFFPLRKEEINEVTVEVSILSEAEPCNLEDIKEGDGIILECGIRKALFLPQVWEELKTKEEFLSNLCLKAGLNPYCWKDKNCKFYKFYVIAYKEVKPNGEVKRVM